MSIRVWLNRILLIFFNLVVDSFIMEIFNMSSLFVFYTSYSLFDVRRSQYVGRQV